MDVKFDLQGLDTVLKNFQQIPQDMQKKGARFALRKAALLVLEAAQANAERVDDPMTVSVISENIALRFDNRHYRSTGEIKFRVGVLGGAKTKDKLYSENLPGGGTQHWRLLEFGTENMPAQPIMRPALANNIEPATNKFALELKKWLARYVKRMQKAGGK